MLQATRILSYLLILIALVFVQIMARPQNTIDSQETGETVPNLPELRKFYTAMNTIASGMGQYPDENALDRLQIQLLEQYAQNKQNNGVRGGGLNYMGDQLVRIPETKRQSRYRQCYFNPISCFRK